MNTLVPWGPRAPRNPFAEFDAILRQNLGEQPGRRQTGFVPAAEIDRDGDDALLRVELPGVDASKDVSVELEGHRLVVRGERRDERSEQQHGRTLREVRYGSFHRSFALPEHISEDAISATYDTGVLNVRVAGAYTGGGARRIPVGSADASAPQAAAAAGEQPQQDAA
jgi:HSP20 family molecular chaperone IbpA